VIEQIAQGEEGLDVQAWRRRIAHVVACQRIEHPRGDSQLQAILELNPTATFIFDMSGATQYASPPYPIIPKETVYVTSLSDRRRKLCHSHV